MRLHGVSFASTESTTHSGADRHRCDDKSDLGRKF